MNGRFSPHKSFSQVKTKITLFFKISYFRPYVYSFCHHFLTKKVNSAPFFIILPVQKRFSRGIIPKKNTNGRTPVFGHHYPIMARFRHFTHPTTAGSLHFETRPEGMIPAGRATRQETETETENGDGERRRRTENGQDRVNTAKATLPDVRAPVRPNRSARTRVTHRHKIAPTSGAYGDIRPTQNSPNVRSVRNVSKPTRKSSDRQGPRFTPDTKKLRRKPSGLFFRKRSAYSSLR